MSNNNVINNDEFLQVKDLVVEYTSEGDLVHAVNGVSFSVRRGRSLGLVGETGAGKTSIAKAIIGVLPDISARVTAGEIFLDGKDLLKAGEKEMRKVRGRRISMIFQDPMTALNPTMRIGNQIAEVIKLHNDVSKAEATKRAVEMLEMVGIPAERFTEYPHQFSGGMKQRVVIAMALACHPELLIADEPTTALDVTIQAQVLEMMTNLKNELQTSLIMITHDLGVVAETCDDVAVVYAGQVLEYGSLEEIFDNPTHPYTVGLFGALPSMNEDKDRLSPIDGLPPDPTNLPQGCKFSPRCPYATLACQQADIPLQPLGGTHLCRCLKVKQKEET